MKVSAKSAEKNSFKNVDGWNVLKSSATHSHPLWGSFVWVRIRSKTPLIVIWPIYWAAKVFRDPNGPAYFEQISLKEVSHLDF